MHTNPVFVIDLTRCCWYFWMTKGNRSSAQGDFGKDCMYTPQHHSFIQYFFIEDDDVYIANLINKNQKRKRSWHFVIRKFEKKKIE